MQMCLLRSLPLRRPPGQSRICFGGLPSWDETYPTTTTVEIFVYDGMLLVGCIDT